MLEIYEKHAALLGFSVRKHTTRYFPGTKNVMEKYFVCCAQGKRNINRKKKVKKDRNDKEDEGKKKRKPRKVSITRTDCKACIRVKYNEEGLFEVIHHVIAHNHDLTRTQWNYLHRSQREITKEKGQAIESMQKSGLSAMDSYSYMCEEAGGEECVGHSVRDHLNYCTRLKMKTIEGGDAQSLIDILYHQVASDPEFFFRVRLDKDGRVCNIFWRDSMMMEDYNIYGDVVVFDTTYRTNRYNLICAPIVGINNHWKNVMFGCAFIGDEKIESFVWLLETFKKSMGNKAPITLFTDQDIAMSKAISKVLFQL
ncbi:Protein FAR1-RELATED SEQUENCE 5 [Bienertia sinuspersici]